MKDEQLIPNHKVELPAGNPLDIIFLNQLKFQKRFHDFNTMSDDQHADYTRTMALAAMVECVEALNWTNWKTWKQVKHEFNKQEYANELADIIIFVTNLAIQKKIGPDILTKAILNKQIENINRQEKGY